MQTAVASAIGIGVLYVAWQQWRLAQRKLKMDLFDRRFKIYEAVRDMIGQSTTSGLSSTEVAELMLKTREAEFLFKSDVPDYITEVWTKVMDHADTHRRFATMDLSEQQRLTLMLQDTQCVAWLGEQARTGCAEKFRPYLSMEWERTDGLSESWWGRVWNA